jgi:two-component system response regulator MprA
MENEKQSTRKRLLLVGDELHAIFLILSYLESCGYEVASSKDGHDALEFLSRDVPNLIIFCNDGMPAIDGYSFLRTIRGNCLTKTIPLILISSKNQTVEQIRSLDREMDAYVVCPFEPEELKHQVHSMIQRNLSLAYSM